MKYLTNKKISAIACGKTILIGEHSVVYGHHAVAMALPDVTLSISILDPLHCQNWESAWKTIVSGVELDTQGRISSLFISAFEKALELCGMHTKLSQYKPQQIVIESKIPLGSGMGGSAAISTALLDLACQIANKNLSFEQKILFANEIDCLFHSGKASGLDVAAVASHGIIRFSKKTNAARIKNKCTFWIALVDSKIRSETSVMIKKVALGLETQTQKIAESLQNLGTLAEETISCLEAGNMSFLAEKINQSHLYLQRLGVSTEQLDQIVFQLKQAGALAAKLTGAGGGGLVLGIFQNEPQHLFQFFNKNDIFVTKVTGAD